MARHVAGHLKSLVLLSIRYLDHDATAGQGDSDKAATSADDDDSEGSSRADKSANKILDNILQADRSHDGEDERLEKVVETDDGEASTDPRQNIRKEQCRQLFHLILAGSQDATYKWYKDQVEPRSQGTCEWFLHHEYFKKWLEQDSGLLLVSGNPGCGKSVLAKHLIDEALPRSAIIWYFFFKEYDQNTFNQALCALLHQLFIYGPSLVQHAMSGYSGWGKHPIEHSFELQGIFEECARDILSTPLIIVLGALDECHESHSRGLCLLTSRPYSHIVSEFEKQIHIFPHIHILGEEQSDVIRDEIDRYSGYRLEQLTMDIKLSSQIKGHLFQRLLEIPHRTYLWVYFVFGHLKAANLHDIQKEAIATVAALPKNVHEAYERILNRHEEYSIVRNTLSIILVASRPLTLLEVNTALVNESLRSFILAESLSPATVLSKLNWHHSITYQSAHTNLASLCLRYLNLFNSEVTLVQDANAEYSHPLDSHAFLCYSAQHWGTHFEEADTRGDDSSVVALALKICDVNSRAYSVWSELYMKRYGRMPGVGIESSEIIFSRTPLSWAAEKGHEAVVRLLLKRGADFQTKDTYGRTPLSLAVRKRHEAVVQPLRPNLE
ncbi:hypothetical protein GGR58DRAFT_516571 [Xylaria digitata]|nr:hypothetical protein GGR58DRAFT_516571 [Xylaria digitata]